MDQKKLNQFRVKIDEIDLKLLYLLNQRAELVVDLAEIKVAEGKKLYDGEREKEIFVKLTGKNPGPLSPEAVVRLYERIIDESRRLERTEVYDRKKK